MIDLDALARAAGNAARPTTADALLAARTFERVHVITTLGPTDEAAVFLHAEMLTPYARWSHDVRITRCSVTHTGPPCPGPCTRPNR